MEKDNLSEQGMHSGKDNYLVGHSFCLNTADWCHMDNKTPVTMQQIPSC
jgi:hypothetical protein